MRKVSAAQVLSIRITRNTKASSRNSQWARILDAKTNRVLHTGQINYIRKVARDRYNVSAGM